MQRADHTSVRSHNELLILRLIRRDQPVSMAALAQMTGLQHSTVSRLVKRLAKFGLVSRAGLAGSETGGGRPAIQWVLNTEHTASIGIYLASNLVAGVAIDLNRQILATCALPFPIETRSSEREIRTLIQQAAEMLASSERIGNRTLSGVGITTLGLVTPGSSAVRYFDLELNFDEILGENFGTLRVENDANAVARGESDHGALAEIDHAVVLYAHEGIGAGLVLGGSLHRGARGAAGEVAYRECSPLPNPIVQPEPEIFDMFAWGVCALVNLLNPEVCLLTGDLHGLRDELIPRIVDKLKHFTNPVARDVAICSKPCDPMEVALHMATIVLDDLFFQSGENLQSLTAQRGKATNGATNHLAQRTLRTAQ